MTEEIKDEILEVEHPKISTASFGSFTLTYGGISENWSPDEVDKLEVLNLKKYTEIVGLCRFFYRRDPIASTVLNKLIEIGITELIFDKDTLSDNEYRIFIGLKDDLQDFAEQCALEYLITGLVVPEVDYTAVDKDYLKDIGVKKYSTLSLPTMMWVRDSATVKINSPLISGRPSYFVKIPEELVIFITNKGTYPDGTQDKKLYEQLKEAYPEFVSQILDGKTEVLLDNDLILRRRNLPDSAYPTPYLYPALESLKHKRNMRRMDYSIASRVISAIMLIRQGNDEYPILEGEEDAFESIKNQMTWRQDRKNIERIFQLFANHTVSIEWIFPPSDILLDDKKYTQIDQDIFFSLGFPRILTTGETLRTGTSDPEFAALSPVRTMENLQKNILKIIRGIVKEIAKLNNLRSYPTVRFSNINLYSFQNLVDAMQSLYDSGNISRTSYDNVFGFDFEEEAKQRKLDNDLMIDLGLEEFAPKPYSNQPGNEQKVEQEKDTNKENSDNFDEKK